MIDFLKMFGLFAGEFLLAFLMLLFVVGLNETLRRCVEDDAPLLDTVLAVLAIIVLVFPLLITCAIYWWRWLA